MLHFLDPHFQYRAELLFLPRASGLSCINYLIFHTSNLGYHSDIMDLVFNAKIQISLML
jgi:hypothetical protein